MRTFGTDSPEFMVFKIEGSKETYKIPLAASLTNKKALEFEECGDDYHKQVEWLRDFIGDMVDEITPTVTGEILREWARQSRGQGAEVGESQTSSES